MPAQLPPDVAAFTGRAAQLKLLDGLLPDPDGTGPAVVVTAIAGLAGVGKTALAVHWGHRMRAHFPDGQLYVNLRGHAAGPPMTNVEALTHLLRSLGVPPEELTSDVDTDAGRYRSLLAQRRVLVVLDNTASADQVRPLLPSGPGSVVLVTSRDRLTGLVARDGAHRLTLDVLEPDEAHQLLTRLLGAERVAAEPDAAVELARACSYLPLALRIAAANATDHPWSSIATQAAALRGDEPLTALELAGDEQSGVRRAFNRSYQELPPEVRLLFRLLGTVPGADLTVEAAAALAATTPDRATWALQRLARAHLVHPAAPGRYACHDLIRHFAAGRARLELPDGDGRAALRRLSDWYLHSCDTAARLLYPHRLRLPVPPIDASVPLELADEGEALAWLDAERANLVATIHHAATHGPRRTAWLLADTLRSYFWLRLHTADWANTATVALAAAEAEGDRRAQAAALLSIGDTEDRQNRRTRAIERYEHALALADETGWVDAAAAALGKLGSLLMESGRLRESSEYYHRALTVNAAGGTPHAEAVILGSLGSIHFQLGDLDEAIAFYRRTLALFRQIGSRQGEAAALDALGEVLHAQGRLDEATSHLTRALELEREIGDRGTEASSLRTLVAVYRDSGQSAAAVELAQAAHTLADELDDRRIEAETLNMLGAVRHHVGRHRDAIDHYDRALALSRRIGYRYTEVEALLGLAVAHQALGGDEPAQERVEEARTIAGQLGFGLLARRADAIAGYPA